MLIKGIIETSLLDWNGKITTVLFVPQCNFSCPYCQNWELISSPEKFESIDFERIKNFLLAHKEFIDGVCITGGEPTLYKDLPEFIFALKELGFKVKLDTNGTNPEMIDKLIKEKLIDYVALDIKAPFEKYALLAGVNINLEKIKATVSILMNSSIEHEFRTTVVPVLLDENDIPEIAKSIKGATSYVLQQFEPANVRDEKLRKILPYDREKLEKMAARAREFVSEVKLRGVW